MFVQVAIQNKNINKHMFFNWLDSQSWSLFTKIHMHTGITIWFIEEGKD
jgi:hypothetical protein